MSEPRRIALDDALDLVVSGVAPVRARDVPLGELDGCVAARTLTATSPVPAFDASAMDGYAYRADALGPASRLRVVATRLAGTVVDLELGPSEAVRIMTGAALPPGADTVVRLEDTRASADGAEVVVVAPPARRANVRPCGDSVAVGDELVRDGEAVTPAHVGLVAGQGVTSLLARPRPRVGVLSTGDEVVGAGEPLARGQIHDSNRPVLLALVARAGLTPVDLGAAPDDLDRVADALARAAGDCDAVVTTGGVSVGDADVVAEAIARVTGRAATAWRVDLRPGRPFAFGARADGRAPVFGVPGNPLAALVSFHLLVRPGLQRLAGRPASAWSHARATLDCPLTRRADGRIHAEPVVTALDASGRLRVVESRPGGSHQLRATAEATGLALVPDGTGLGVGDLVDVVLFDPVAGAGPR